MKTNFLFAVLFALTLGCRSEFVDLCPGEDQIATAVAIESDCVEADGTSAVTANDVTGTDHYKLHAHVWRQGGAEFFKDVTWSVDDSTAFDLAPIPASPETSHEAATLILATADILDLGGDAEPETTVTVCVTNDCTHYTGGGECAVCVPEVCSEPHTIRSVVNAEGAWELEGTTFPVTPHLQLTAVQTGREIQGITGYLNPEIHGRQIEFSSGDWHYLGTFTDHEHVTGEVNLISTGEDLGPWTATKCPDSGCPDPTP